MKIINKILPIITIATTSIIPLVSTSCGNKQNISNEADIKTLFNFGYQRKTGIKKAITFANADDGLHQYLLEIKENKQIFYDDFFEFIQFFIEESLGYLPEQTWAQDLITGSVSIELTKVDIETNRISIKVFGDFYGVEGAISDEKYIDSHIVLNISADDFKIDPVYKLTSQQTENLWVFKANYLKFNENIQNWDIDENVLVNDQTWSWHTMIDLEAVDAITHDVISCNTYHSDVNYKNAIKYLLSEEYYNMISQLIPGLAISSNYFANASIK